MNKGVVDFDELARIYERHPYGGDVEEILDIIDGLPDKGVALFTGALDKENDDHIKHVAMGIMNHMDLQDDLIEPLIAILIDEHGYCCLYAADLLSRYGEKAIDAIPLLNNCLDDPNDSTQLIAAAAISSICPERFEEMLPRLLEFTPQEHNWTYQKLAIEAIGKHGKAFPETVLPMLNRLLTESYSFTQCATSTAIAEITGDKSLPVSLGRYLLGDGDYFSRFWAVLHLQNMGKDAEPALDDLRNVATSDSCEPVRKAAREAIEAIEHSDD